MPSVSKQTRRRLAARSTAVLPHQRDAAPAVAVHVGKLDLEARKSIDSYEVVRTTAAKGRDLRASRVEETEKRTRTGRLCPAQLSEVVPCSARSTSLFHPTLTDDVLAQAERLIPVVEDHREERGELPWTDASTFDPGPGTRP